MTDRSIQVVMTENAWDGPTLLADGTTQTLTASLAGSLVQDGKARYSNPNDQTSRPGLYGDLDTRAAELAAMGGLYNPADGMIDHIASGLALPTSGTIGVAAMTAGVAYVSGYRVANTGTVLALQESKDNYVDLDYQNNVVISAVTTGAGAPAKAANSIRLGYITTGATTITSATTNVKDSNGNWMGNRADKPYARSLTPGAFMSGTGDQPVAFGANSTKFDNASMHSETTNSSRFLIPADGVYDVQGIVILAAAKGSSEMWGCKIFKGGSSAALGTSTADGMTTLTQRCGAPIDLKQGEYVELVTSFTVSTSITAALLTVAKR